MLAQDFEAKFYDRELLNLAAKESGFSEKFFKQIRRVDSLRSSLSRTTRRKGFCGDCLMCRHPI